MVVVSVLVVFYIGLVVVLGVIIVGDGNLTVKFGQNQVYCCCCCHCYFCFCCQKPNFKVS